MKRNSNGVVASKYVWVMCKTACIYQNAISEPTIRWRWWRGIPVFLPSCSHVGLAIGPEILHASVGDVGQIVAAE